MDIEQKVNDLITCMEVLRGLKKGTINSRARNQKIACSRQVLSNFIMNEFKIKPAQMEMFIDRHRTDFYYMKNLHKAVIKDFHYYPEYHKLYEQFKTIYYGDNKRHPKQYMSLLMELNMLKKHYKVVGTEIQRLETELQF